VISCTRTEPGGCEPLAADYDGGEVITPDAVRSVRPGFGLPPKHYDAVLGKRIKHDVSVGTPLAWDLLA